MSPHDHLCHVHVPKYHYIYHSIVMTNKAKSSIYRAFNCQKFLTCLHAVLNIGSASQLSVIKPKAENLCFSLPSSVMEVPYFDGNTLLTAASLAGGNVVATFVEMLQSWMTALGVTDIPDESSIYAKLVSLACESVSNSRKLQLIDVSVTLWGERHEPGAMGVVSNITPKNLELGGVGHAMLRGIVTNLRRMMPQEVFERLKVCLHVAV